jgi:hypothetical protein
MASYKVTTGIHFQEGKKYKKGDTVESAMDLITLFPEKFTKVETLPAEEKPPGWDDEDEDREGRPKAGTLPAHKPGEPSTKPTPPRTMRDK